MPPKYPLSRSPASIFTQNETFSSAPHHLTPSLQLTATAMQLHLLQGPTWHSFLPPLSQAVLLLPLFFPRTKPSACAPRHPTLSLLLTATAEHWYLPWSLPRVGLSSACLLLALSRLRASVPSHPRPSVHLRPAATEPGVFARAAEGHGGGAEHARVGGGAAAGGPAAAAAHPSGRGAAALPQRRGAHYPAAQVRLGPALEGGLGLRPGWPATWFHGEAKLPSF